MSPLEQYNSIIDYWQKNPLVKGERHHIIPKSCGGCNRKWNLVKLTPEEHIECHRLLTLIYATGDEHFRMCAAYALMCTSRSKVKVSDEQAAEARRLSSESRKGKHLTKEHRSKLSLAHMGKSPWNKGKKIGPHTEERNRKASESLKGKNKGKAPWNKGKHLTEEDKQKKREAALRNIARRKASNS